MKSKFLNYIVNFFLIDKSLYLSLYEKYVVIYLFSASCCWNTLIDAIDRNAWTTTGACICDTVADHRCRRCCCCCWWRCADAWISRE